MVRRAVAVVLLAGFLVIPASSTRVAAQSRPLATHEVEAAYLYQIGRYVEWPADKRWASDMFFICVLGADPFGAALDEIVEGKVIAGQPVAPKRILGPTESQDCRIVFVSPSEEGRLPMILQALEGTGAVTVSRGTQFTRRGGMIAFVNEDRKVRFVVNLAAAERARLQLSSQLLRVAVRVEQ
jgi:hypothetical protein